MYRRSNFRPNIKAFVKRSLGYDESGKRVYEEPVKIGISIVNLKSQSRATSIRADKSGTKSRADESVSQGRVLVSAETEVRVGDLLIINHEEWEVNSKTPRFDQVGRIHHYQVDLS